MKITAVSGDLVLKLALYAAAIGAIWWVARSARSQIADTADAAAEWARNVALTTLNPASDQNAVYQAANALVPAGDTVGTYAHRVFGSGDQAVADMLAGRAPTINGYSTDNLGAMP